MKRGKKFLDLVIGGCDFSGTSTQVNDLMEYFKLQGKIVRDLRGNEKDVLFHTKRFRDYNMDYASYDEFFFDESIPMSRKMQLSYEMDFLVKDLNRKHENIVVGSFLKELPKTYIDPNSAHTWIMEEPTRRGAGQVNRVIEQNRRLFSSNMDPIAAAFAHQAYRTDEFLRFRKYLREFGKIIIRSRSEESACYQIFDEKDLPNGISKERYLILPGHEIAFGNAPTNIFVVHGPIDWAPKDYINLKKQREKGRLSDDHESNIGYQLFVNKRYATNWLEELYAEGCRMHGGNPPEITRFNIYNSKKDIRNKMIKKLESILKSDKL